MNRRIIVIVIVSLVSMVAGFVLYQLKEPSLSPIESPLTEAKPSQADAPVSLAAIPLIDLKGVQQTLGDWKQPVLVVNFWAPWCVPCRREVPDLIELQREYGDQVQILGLAFDSVENVESFVDEYQMNYPSFIANQYIPMYSAVFNNKSGALPFTAIIGPNRKIGYTHTGIVSLQTLREQVSKLL